MSKNKSLNIRNLDAELYKDFKMAVVKSDKKNMKACIEELMIKFIEDCDLDESINKAEIDDMYSYRASLIKEDDSSHAD
jgi:hypothetical protein